MLISIETHILCDFPGGGGGCRHPPLDPHTSLRISGGTFVCLI